MPFTVLAVDDDPHVVHLLAVWIDDDERLQLAATAGNGAEALELVSRGWCPDAIICDVVMPVMTGIEALPRLRRACPDAVIAMFSATPDIAVLAPHLGADAVFDKLTAPDVVLDHLVTLCRHRTCSR